MTPSHQILVGDCLELLRQARSHSPGRTASRIRSAGSVRYGLIQPHAAHPGSVILLDIQLKVDRAECTVGHADGEA